MNRVSRISKGSIDKVDSSLRGKHTDKQQYRLGIHKPDANLVFAERLVLDPSFVPGDTFDGDEPLAVRQEPGV
jgi:hypothetical protein